ncbi:MAG: flagellar basal body P-ring formation chaperone FlgA, partial [Candidatus Methylomirabilis sp.]|nr:flagellar basal body P-ring formation chaperone FlgA [Deltaproteobacteria bacterium]
VERSALVGAAFASPEEVAGRRARQMLDVGAVLYANAVDMPPLVRRGSMVNLVIESAQLSISTLGEVKQNASAGESVRVQNVGSGKVVVGVVVDAQTVKVRF